MRGASGGAAQESMLLELEDTVVDVEGVRHHDGVRDALPVEFAVGAGALARIRTQHAPKQQPKNVLRFLIGLKLVYYKTNVYPERAL